MRITTNYDANAITIVSFLSRKVISQFSPSVKVLAFHFRLVHIAQQCPCSLKRNTQRQRVIDEQRWKADEQRRRQPHTQTPTTHRASWCDALNVASCVSGMHYLLDRKPGSVAGRVTKGRGVVVSCGSKMYESKSLTFPRTTLPLHCWNWHLPPLSLSQATFINAVKEIDTRWYSLSYSSVFPLLSIDRKLADNILWVVDRVAPIHIIFAGIFAFNQGCVLDIVLWTGWCAAYAIEFTS